MKTEKTREARICPLCQSRYTAVPALSRTDNETLICPDCGTRQALEGLGIEAEERERILATIHRSTAGRIVS